MDIADHIGGQLDVTGVGVLADSASAAMVGE
jgi:hypothetical protein